jgi:hypothetical protein
MRVAPLKRSRAFSPSAEPLLQTLVRALPIAVREDLLLRLLRRKDAARLGCTCRELRALVNRDYALDIGTVKLPKLKAALTTFPRARKVKLCHDEGEGWGAVQRKALVKWLCEGGHGGSITTMPTTGLQRHYPLSQHFCP